MDAVPGDVFAIFGSDSSDDDAAVLPPQPLLVSSFPPLQHCWELVASRETDGGKGLRATANIREGAEIHREGAALRAPNGHAAASREAALALHKQCVLARFDRLPAAARDALMVLYSRDTYNDADDNATIYGVFQTNSVRLSGRDECDGGVFLVMCRMNHACRPNVAYIWRPDLQKLLLVAKRDISAGEELYTTYLSRGVGMDTTAERRAHLLREFGFHCMCGLCVQSDAPQEARPVSVA